MNKNRSEKICGLLASSRIKNVAYSIQCDTYNCLISRKKVGCGPMMNFFKILWIYVATRISSAHSMSSIKALESSRSEPQCSVSVGVITSRSEREDPSSILGRSFRFCPFIPAQTCVRAAADKSLSTIFCMDLKTLHFPPSPANLTKTHIFKQCKILSKKLLTCFLHSLLCNNLK